MDAKTKQIVMDCMPIACKVLADGKSYDGIIEGRKLDFPVVSFNGHGICEVSWQLALRCMKGDCQGIIY